MLTRQDGLLEFMGQEGASFTIPHYQRAYAWTTRQCDELFQDIMRAGAEGSSHFMSMVLFLKADASKDGLSELDVIDGQQRLATTTILLAAFVETLRACGLSIDGVSADDIECRYVTVPGESGARAKIRLQGLDGETLDALVCNGVLPRKPAARIVDNHLFFLGKMGEPDFDPMVFWRGMKELLIIDAEIDAGDKAQSIFESLNTKGLPLTTADLVRNYLLVGETRSEQERLYKEYWNPIELMFGEDKGSHKLNAGIRMWLSIRFRNMRIHDKSQTYNAFKRYMAEEFTGTTEELLIELRGFCLMWAENYKFNEVKEFRCMDWAGEKTKSLLPGWGHQSGF